MNGTHSTSENAIPRDPTAERASLWDRLRESIERLRTVGRQGSQPEAVAQKRAARAKLLRSQVVTEGAAAAPLVCLAFRQGQERYGIPIDDVLEVVPLEQFSPVPRTPPFIRGVIPWRGEILALLDLGRLFGIAETGISDLKACVIVEAAGKRIAVAARETEDLLGIPREQLQAGPELTGTVLPEWVLGVHDENRMIVRMETVLQDERLVAWRNA